MKDYLVIKNKSDGYISLCTRSEREIILDGCRKSRIQINSIVLNSFESMEDAIKYTQRLHDGDKIINSILK